MSSFRQDEAQRCQDFVKTADGETRIPSDATLGQAGVLDGQQLRILREPMGMQSKARTVKAYLRTEAGAVLPLEADNVVIGRRDAEHQAPIDVDLSTHDPNNAVSRRHASIGREGMKYYLIDLESTNAERHELRHQFKRIEILWR